MNVTTTVKSPCRESRMSVRHVSFSLYGSAIPYELQPLGGVRNFPAMNRRGGRAPPLILQDRNA